MEMFLAPLRIVKLVHFARVCDTLEHKEMDKKVNALTCSRGLLIWTFISSYLNLFDFNLIFNYRSHLSKHARPRKFCQKGSNGFFFLIRGEKTQRLEIPLKAGHHRPASETPFKCWLGSFVIFQGIWTSIAKKP